MSRLTVSFAAVVEQSFDIRLHLQSGSLFWDAKKARSAVLTSNGDLFTDSLLEPYV